MKLADSVKPISYLKAHASELVRKVAEEHSPLLITQNGEAKAVLQDVASYEQLQESLAMLKILAQSAKSKQQGKTRTARQAFREVRKALKEGR